MTTKTELDPSASKWLRSHALLNGDINIRADALTILDSIEGTRTKVSRSAIKWLTIVSIQTLPGDSRKIWAQEILQYIDQHGLAPIMPVEEIVKMREVAA